jgi:non-canonical (house-cleaning) NTP pyrophosphatase
VLLFFHSKVESGISTLVGQMNTIVLASASPPKQQAVREAFLQFSDSQPSLIAIGVKIEDIVAPQPFGDEGGEFGVRSRISAVKQDDQYQALFHSTSPRYVIAIENYIRLRDDGEFEDIALCGLQLPALNELFFGRSSAIHVPRRYVQLAQAATPPGYRLAHTGLMVTAGRMIAEHSGIVGIAADNWMEHAEFGGLSRVMQVKEAVCAALVAEQAAQIGLQAHALVRMTPGSCTPVDVAPLLAHSSLLRRMVSVLAQVPHRRVDVVMACDRDEGAVLACALAMQLSAGFVCCRSSHPPPDALCERVDSGMTELFVCLVPCRIDVCVALTDCVATSCSRMRATAPDSLLRAHRCCCGTRLSETEQRSPP